MSKPKGWFFEKLTKLANHWLDELRKRETAHQVKAPAAKPGSLPGFDPPNPDSGRRELTPASYPLTSTGELQHMCVHTQKHIYIHTKINKLVRKKGLERWPWVRNTC